jgi:N-acetylglucosamine kinase-like BadF-type ATPase
LVAGASAGWGIGLSAGTSCNCYGRDRDGRIGRVVGSSYFGENAGAGEIVHRALQAVARAWSRRGPETALSRALVEAVGAENVGDLLAGLMRRRYRLTPAQAPLVFATADAGDEVARRIVAWAGAGLADLALGVARQLGLESLAFELVLAGSLFDHRPELAALVDQELRPSCPQAQLVRLDAPPVAGAVLLGLEAAGASTADTRARLVAEARDRAGRQQ